MTRRLPAHIRPLDDPAVQAMRKRPPRRCQFLEGGFYHKIPSRDEMLEDNLNEHDLLGRGTYGRVYKATMRQDGQDSYTQVAIKVHIEHTKDYLHGIPPAAIREINNLKLMYNFHWITQLHRVVSRLPIQTSGDHRIVDPLDDNPTPIDDASSFDRMPSGDEEYPPFREICMVFALGDHSLSGINHNKNFGDNVTENDLKLIMLHIAKSIEVTHSFGVAHRDLKLANILVQENRCQLTDFGLARRLRSRDDSPPLTGKVCTLWYRPPECFLQTPSPKMRNKVHIRYDRKIDIWSLGCMMFELLTGKVLFPAKPKANEDGEEIAMRLIYSKIGTPASTGWATGLDLLRHRYARPELAPPARDTGFVPPVPYHGVAAYRRKQRDDLTLVAMPTEVRAHPVVQEMLDPKARRPIKSDDSLYLAVDLMMWMLDLDPDRRPTIQQVLGHPWLKSTQVKDAPSPERYEVDFPRLIGREGGPCLDIQRAREEALRRNQQCSISVQARPLPATAGVVGQGRQAYLAPTRRGRGAGVGKRKLPDRGRGKRGRYN